MRLLQGTAGRPAMGRLQRVAVEHLRIRGKFPGGKDKPRSVFFQLGAAELDDDETTKLAKLAMTYKTSPLTIVASASEDEALLQEGELQLIMKQRLLAVVKTLKLKGYTGTAKGDLRGKAGLGNIDYRQARRVEIVPPMGATTLSRTRPAKYQNGGVEHTTRFDEVMKEANAFLDPAIATLSSANMDNGQRELLKRFFGDTSAATVANNLTLIKQHIGTRINHLLQVVDDTPVGGPGYVIAATSSGTSSALNDGVGDRSIVTLYPSFMNGAIADCAGTLIHEAAHGTPAIETKDFAYKSDRTIEFLDAERALKNSDSYVLLVRLLKVPGSVTAGKPNIDFNDDEMKQPEVFAGKRAIAWVEKWLTNAYQDVEELYNQVSPLKPGDRLPEGYYWNLMEKLHTEFQVTSPGQDVAPQDVVALAGIFHRLRAMRLLFSVGVGLLKGEAETTFIDNILATRQGFESTPPADQVKEALRAVINANGDIDVSHRDHFVNTIVFCKDASALGSP
jgi:hypothetical protein